MFTANHMPAHASPYDELDLESASGEWEDLPGFVVAGIIIGAVGFGLVIGLARTPYNLYHMFRLRRQEHRPSPSSGGWYG